MANLTKDSTNGGRVAILLLLFLLALYKFYTSGLGGFAMIYGALPIGLFLAYFVFHYRMISFWTLFIVNYFIMFIVRFNNIGMPASLPNELLEILLIFLAIIDAKDMEMERVVNTMFFMLFAWCAFCTLEILNDTCDLGLNFAVWYQGVRLMAFQLMYAFVVVSIYLYRPKDVMRFIFLWGICILVSTYWVFQQKYIGLTPRERSWLLSEAGRSHNLTAGTRYWSTFSDAATFGIHMAAAACAFFITAITTRIKRHRYILLLFGLMATWSMFTSGTRTAIFCMIVGFALYMILARSFKIVVPVSLVFGLFIGFLAFTNIANGNQMIRRMRSGFKKGDASTNVRDMNKEALRKYIADAPWGLGLGMNYNVVPPGNKYKVAAGIPPDSEYVYIWVHTGIIGITIFVVTTVVMLFGACWIVMFRLRNGSLRGVGAGFCCAFLATHLGGYGNQILMQFPNIFIIYGGLALVYALPKIEPEWEKYEQELLTRQEEKRQKKLEARRAQRV